MLKVADAVGQCATGSSQEIPDLASIPFARARVGWRILSALKQGHDASDASSFVAPAKVGAVDDQALVIGPGCKWFKPPGGVVVDLSRKRTLRPMLELLARNRESEPGVALDVDKLFSGVWPGERALPEAKKNRVYVSVATLRKMGLSDVLTSRGDGYLLSPDVAVQLQ